MSTSQLLAPHASRRRRRRSRQFTLCCTVNINCSHVRSNSFSPIDKLFFDEFRKQYSLEHAGNICKSPYRTIVALNLKLHFISIVVPIAISLQSNQYILDKGFELLEFLHSSSRYEPGDKLNVSLHWRIPLIIKDQGKERVAANNFNIGDGRTVTNSNNTRVSGFSEGALHFMAAAIASLQQHPRLFQAAQLVKRGNLRHKQRGASTNNIFTTCNQAIRGSFKRFHELIIGKMIAAMRSGIQ
mmetsp:Transcript_3970/g.11279  ORF Transcript_3970/g.11279 Transcript_3970/m.11279 type:complete len:242 (-) Transcript_3970:1030-1755(-)